MKTLYFPQHYAKFCQPVNQSKVSRGTVGKTVKKKTALHKGKDHLTSIRNTGIQANDSMTNFRPSELLLTNHRKFQFHVERNINGRNFVGQS